LRLEAQGVARLEEIFRHSHYHDEHLAATLERATGLPLDDLQAAVGAWWRARRKRPGPRE
jgi:hypothetical protein